MSAPKSNPKRDRQGAARDVVVAQYDTGKWDFLTVADTETEAIRLLRKAWRVHCDQTGADPAFFNTDDVLITVVRPGQVFRDDNPIL